jgi:antitoxin FitA
MQLCKVHTFNAKRGDEHGNADSTKHSRRAASGSTRRAAQHGHSMGAEVRGILESAVNPTGRLKLGSLLADIGRRARLTDEEFTVFEHVRGKAPAQQLETLFLSAITVAELHTNVALLRPSKRKTGLLRKLGDARAVGLAIASADGYIAAIAAANGPHTR